jgi:hypothetical protein
MSLPPFLFITVQPPQTSEPAVEALNITTTDMDISTQINLTEDVLTLVEEFDLTEKTIENCLFCSRVIRNAGQSEDRFALGCGCVS